MTVFVMRDPSAMTMQDKYCRICWNTAGWQKPTGDATWIETGQSYVGTHGFGHEEWLFNYEWLIDGHRYGFLQPIGKFYSKYSGESCSILLYTVTPEKETLLVGRINDAYIPERVELDNVLQISMENGWIDTMRSDVEQVEGNLDDLEDPSPTVIANIRFRPEDVEIFDPRQRVVGDHKILRAHRYQAFDWNDDYPDVDIQPPRIEEDDPRRSEKERTRAAQEGSVVDPRHVRLQNRLYDKLCEKYGHGNVHYERDYVDLVLEKPNGCAFFEIKMEATVKRCVRLAMGQLLEYAHYPEGNRATRLVVVGDAPPTESDRAYVGLLRDRYGLPIYYARFLWENKNCPRNLTSRIDGSVV